MSREKGSVYFSSAFETKKVLPLDARQLVGTYADLTLPATWEDDDNLTWLYTGAMVAVGNDGDPSKNGIYWLCAADYTVSSNWVKVGEGTGTITGGKNGLGTDGANIVLGGDLLSGTTINASGNTFYLTNVNDFQVLTSGLTGIIGIDTTGILLEFSGTSVSLEGNTGLVYNTDYSATFIDNSLVSKKYVDTVATGLQPKTAVWVATTGETVDLTGGTFGGTIDGIMIVNEDRVLIKNQNGSIPDVENGIYIYSGGSNTFYRSPDFNGLPSGEVKQGALIPVLTGVTNQNTLWVLITEDPITVNTTPLSFTPFSTPGNYTGDVGIDITGTVISVDGLSLAGDSILWTGDTFNVDVTTGTLATALASKLNVSVFSGYTGTTETRLQGIENDIIYISGVTDTKLDNNIFTGYTASTEIRLTGIEDDVDYLSGITESKLDASIFTGYTANTEIRLQGIENDIQYISGVTDSKLNTTTFANYTGSTQPILNAALTGATNGLNFLDRCVKLGGDLIENTIINLNVFDFKFSGDSVQYDADYSGSYVPRSLVDKEYVDNQVTGSSNTIGICNVLGSYTGTTTDDFIGVSGGTAVCITLPANPKFGQRISVSDVCGNALADNITILCNSAAPSRSINGAASALINTEYGSITFINNGSFWSAVAFIN